MTIRLSLTEAEARALLAVIHGAQDDASNDEHEDPHYVKALGTANSKLRAAYNKAATR